VPLEHFFAPPPRRRSIVRNHPLLIATTAASAGVLLGAYVAVQLLVTPPVKNDDSARATVQAAVESKAPRAETTGQASPQAASQASSGEREGTATDCSRQTWPYLSRDCMEINKSGPRVVTTDRLDQPTVNAIENPSAAAKTEPPSQALANASAAAPATPPAAALTAPPAATAAPLTPPTTPPAATAPVAAPAPAPAAASQDAVAPDPAPAKAAKTKQAKKPKQKPKFDDRALARTDDDRVPARVGDDDAAPVSREPSDDRRVSQDRSRRTAGRWTEREYEVPSSDGRGQRRVIVIRRNDGGSVDRGYSDGLFERRDSGGLLGGLFGFR